MDNKKIVYTYGVFDLFHKGHIDLLKEARALGDTLIVGVFSDRVAAEFKRKPIIALDERLHILAHCKFVDQAIVQDELLPDENLKKIRPHILAKGPGAGWEADGKKVPGEEVMKQWGGDVVRLDYHHGISTSDIIRKIKNLAADPRHPSHPVVISNHLLESGILDLPAHAVIRVNIAWFNSKEEVMKSLQNIKHDIYLDHPNGRRKPPQPKLRIEEAIDLAKIFPNVKYFAVSNAEDPTAIHDLRIQLPETITLVPKIETVRGVHNLDSIIKKINATHIMLDKEDLYRDVNHDNEAYEHFVKLVRDISRERGVALLELQGVVFSPRLS